MIHLTIFPICHASRRAHIVPRHESLSARISVSSRDLMSIVLAYHVSVLFIVSRGWHLFLFPDVSPFDSLLCDSPIVFFLIMWPTYAHLLFLITAETIYCMPTSLIPTFVLNSFYCIKNIFLWHLSLNVSSLLYISLVINIIHWKHEIFNY